MKKISILSLCFFMNSLISFSQENEKSSNWSASVNYGTGNATLKHNVLGVLNGTVDALQLGVNYKLSQKNDFFLSSGLNVVSFKATFFNDTNQSVLNNTYFQMPFSINDKWTFSSSEKLYTVYGIGLYVNYLGRSVIEDYSKDTKLKTTGFNFGGFINWGFGYDLSDNSAIDLGVNYMTDSDPIKKNGIEQKLDKMLIVRIGYVKRF